MWLRKGRCALCRNNLGQTPADRAALEYRCPKCATAHSVPANKLGSPDLGPLPNGPSEPHVGLCSMLGSASMCKGREMGGGHLPNVIVRSCYMTYTKLINNRCPKSSAPPARRASTQHGALHSSKSPRIDGDRLSWPIPGQIRQVGVARTNRVFAESARSGRSLLKMPEFQANSGRQAAKLGRRRPILAEMGQSHGLSDQSCLEPTYLTEPARQPWRARTAETPAWRAATRRRRPGPQSQRWSGAACQRRRRLRPPCGGQRGEAAPRSLRPPALQPMRCEAIAHTCEGRAPVARAQRQSLGLARCLEPK